jgi:hypothetical protein
VTRLDPIFAQWVTFTLDIFLSIKVANIFGPLFPTVKECALNLTKMFWATSWAIFFTNSSGHPGSDHSEEIDGNSVFKKLKSFSFFLRKQFNFEMYECLSSLDLPLICVQT